MPPVDSLQQHRQLRCAQVNTATGSLRPDEAAAFEPLAKQTQAVAVPPKDLDQIATFAPEDEDVAAERVGVERGLHNGSQAIKAPAHIRHAGDQPDARAGR